MSERPNILIVHADQHRFDALGAAGNIFVETPHLDRLAEEGARFTHAFTVWPLCTPARASTWTGVYPHADGVMFNGFGEPDIFKAHNVRFRTVFELLHEAGWTTGYFGKWHLGHEQPECFDAWHAFNSLGGHWVDGRQASQDGVWLPDADTDRALAFITEHAGSERPFCLAVAFYPPHDPYTAPTEFMEQYRGKGIPVPGYYASCTAVDRNVGRLLEGLERAGEREKTLVMYVSDHGETFNLRDGIQNKLVCHDDSIRIPWIVNFPPTIPAGLVSDAMVGLQDLTPTVLDYARIPVPDDLHGKTLRGLLERSDPEWRDAYYVENVANPHYRWLEGARMIALPEWEQRCLRTRRWKLILSDDGLNSLYDLEVDPEEMLDLYGAPYDDFYAQYHHYEGMDEIVHRLAARLEEEAARLGDELGVRLGRAAKAGPVVRPKLNEPCGYGAAQA